MVKQYPVPPDDVTEDIFARLPAKAVYRCRYLSRTWAARLISDDFADLHFRLANRLNIPKILLLQDYVPRCAKVQVWSPDIPGGTTLMEVPVRDSDQIHLAPYHVTQQCRGLIILQSATTWSYYVLNPSTGRLAVLPKSRAMARDKVTCLGLGYDTHTRKHKVVCINNCGYGEKTGRFGGFDVYMINSTIER
jgi:hypothetical protein